jgi:hypothetical protein
LRCLTEKKWQINSNRRSTHARSASTVNAEKTANVEMVVKEAAVSVLAKDVRVPSVPVEIAVCVRPMDAVPAVSLVKLKDVPVVKTASVDQRALETRVVLVCALDVKAIPAVAETLVSVQNVELTAASRDIYCYLDCYS